MTGRALPVPGSNAALAAPVEPVLRRAIELSAGQSSLGAAGTTLSVEDLRQVASEVEVPPWAVAAALAEQRVVTGLPPAGRLSQVVGPVAVAGWRHVDADPRRAEALVTAWLETAYGLRARRLGDGTVVACRRRGLAGSMARSARMLSGTPDLTGPRDEARAAVVAGDTEGTSSVLSLLVDLRSRRRVAMGEGASVGVVGTAALVSGALVAGAPLLLAAVPVTLGSGVAVAALRHRGVVRSVTEEVEVTLDEVARRRRPAGPVRNLARSVTRRIKPIAGRV